MNLDASYHSIRERIRAACERANRDPKSVTLVAVSKKQEPATVTALAELGQTLFGESRVQEAAVKISLCPSRLRWQMIGHLQTNKVRDAVRLFEMIQSVDSLHLAEEINKFAHKSAKSMPILLEVNIAGDANKFGYPPARLLEELETVNALPHIEIHGLMTIAPWSPTPDKPRAIFQKLREVKTECEQRLGAPLPHLSMGMTEDFEVAIEEGATLVRIGTALFGSR